MLQSKTDDKLYRGSRTVEYGLCVALFGGIFHCETTSIDWFLFRGQGLDRKFTGVLIRVWKLEVGTASLKSGVA
jgi:hypothetical protein